MKRTWHVHADPETGEIAPGHLEQVAADAATVARTVGGVVNLGAHRVEVAPGEFLTVAAIVEWHSYAPAQRAEEDPGEEEGEDGAPTAEALEPVGLTD